MSAADPAIENLTRRLRANAKRLRKHCRINPLFDGGNIKRRHAGHRCQRNVANRAAASAISYRSFGIVPMVRRTPAGYGGNTTGVRFSRSPSSICVPHERRTNECLRIVRRDRFCVAHCGMQRPPTHVVDDDTPKFVQHVAVDAIQQPVEPLGLFVIYGVRSILSVIDSAVEPIQFRPIV